MTRHFALLVIPSALGLSFSLFACGSDPGCPPGSTAVEGRCIDVSDAAAVPGEDGSVPLPEDGSVPLPEDGSVPSEVDASIPADAGCMLRTYYADDDGDGFGASDRTIDACEAPAGHVTEAGDCDDGDADIHPTAAETCDDVDEDCDGMLDEGLPVWTVYRDADGDGFGGSEARETCADLPGYVRSSDDCDDSLSSIHPSASEACNGRDDDCDAATDEGVLTLFFVDADGDGFGSAARSREACTLPAGYATNDDDCDDTRREVLPGGTEVCNELDDDCDGTADEGVQIAFYPDCDNDGFAPYGARPTLACDMPAPTPTCPGGWTTQVPASSASADCRAFDDRAFPGQTSFFTSPTRSVPPAEPRLGGYDYDCDGVETRQYTTAAPTSCRRHWSGVCYNDGGWADGTPPACGVAESYVDCDASCRRSTDRLTQACR